MVARHFIALETRYRHKNPTVKGLRSYDQGRFMAWQKSGRVFVYVDQGQSKCLTWLLYCCTFGLMVSSSYTTVLFQIFADPMQPILSDSTLVGTLWNTGAPDCERK